MTSHKRFRFGIYGLGASREDWVAFARKAEALGYSTLAVGEHPSFGGHGRIFRYGPLGPIAALMAAADATTSLRISSQVLNNDLRHPVLLAQEAATLDVLSGGRLELGLGSGWLRMDYEVAGLAYDPPGVRVSRLSEAVSLIKRLFSDTAVTYQGTHYQVQHCSLSPRPLQRPHPPLLVGGGGRRVLSLAAREADIVSLDPQGTAAGTKDLATTTAEAVAQKVSWVQKAAREHFSAVELHVPVLNVVMTSDRLRGAQQVADVLASFPSDLMSNGVGWTSEAILASPHALIGTVEQIIECVQERRERYGISYMTVGAEQIDAFSPVVARLSGS